MLQICKYFVFINIESLFARNGDSMGLWGENFVAPMTFWGTGKRGLLLLNFGTYDFGIGDWNTMTFFGGGHWESYYYWHHVEESSSRWRMKIASPFISLCSRTGWNSHLHSFLSHIGCLVHDGPSALTWILCAETCPTSSSTWHIVGVGTSHTWPLLLVRFFVGLCCCLMTILDEVVWLGYALCWLVAV